VSLSSEMMDSLIEMQTEPDQCS